MTNVKSLNRNNSFKRLYNRGKSYVSPALVVYVSKNRAGFCRLGITTGKKLGNAVKRNRAKRIIREAFYQLADEIQVNCDIVIVARVKAIHLSSTQIHDYLYDLFNKAKIINVNEDEKNNNINI